MAWKADRFSHTSKNPRPCNVVVKTRKCKSCGEDFQYRQLWGGARWYCDKCRTPIPKECAHCGRPVTGRERCTAKYCIECWKMKRSQWAAENYQRHIPERRARHRRYRTDGLALKNQLAKFGLTIDDYNKRHEEQNGLCAICGSEERTRSRLCIDHDHANGEARGLICGRCNSGLGFFCDSPGTLEIAAEYLRWWAARHAAMRKESSCASVS